ncbi:competence protein ComK [Bacillus sp. FSL K6-3431]|uniref:competence protein ComK n=1 Tax=Bacillus sp. FSL K6-3431 TaxID=2921500 RepID=UPI0040468A8E
MCTPITHEGRRDGTKELTNVTIKAPIIVDPHTPIYLFPTSSPLKPHCMWVASDHIISYKKKDPYTTLVTFRNNQTHEIPMSLASFGNQVSRTARLRIQYSNNVKRMEIVAESASKKLYFMATEKKKKDYTEE